MAGSKVSTKLTILQSLANNVDQLIVGGGIANTFALAAGLPIGMSLAEPDLLGEAKAVIQAMKARGAEVPIPEDGRPSKSCNSAPAGEARPTMRAGPPTMPRIRYEHRYERGVRCATLALRFGATKDK